LWGDDAPNLNSPGAYGNGGNNTSFNDLREAYVELNVPIGTGLNIKAGELISLLNWESGDGGAANPNFSQGNQWWFTGNGPSAGVQASYNFTEKVALTLRVDNGLFQGPVDNNSGKAFSGSINLKPTDKLWVNFVGWYDSQPGDVNTQRGHAVRRRLASPQVVGEPVRRHHLASRQQQPGQQGSLPEPAQVHRQPAALGLDRPEDAELHAPTVSSGGLLTRHKRAFHGAHEPRLGDRPAAQPDISLIRA
jgi:hypothetical protein